MAATYPLIGKPAPEFTALAFGGNYTEPCTVNLAKFRGQRVVLYFYPKDDTPGCTKQACGLRDVWPELSAKAVVFGVSGDGLASHQKFIKKYELPFALLVDEDHAIAEAYGVWVEKSMYGKRYFGVERTSFVIDHEGNIAAVLPKVKPEEHAAKLLSICS